MFPPAMAGTLGDDRRPATGKSLRRDDENPDEGRWKVCEERWYRPPEAVNVKRKRRPKEVDAM